MDDNKQSFKKRVMNQKCSNADQQSSIKPKNSLNPTFLI